jgi:hypothetical protein
MRRINTDFQMTEGARASFDEERQEDLKTGIFLSSMILSDWRGVRRILSDRKMVD